MDTQEIRDRLDQLELEWLRDGEPNSDAIKAICISRQLADEVDRLRNGAIEYIREMDKNYNWRDQAKCDAFEAMVRGNEGEAG
jgi:hypothetical protein